MQIIHVRALDFKQYHFNAKSSKKSKKKSSRFLGLVAYMDNCPWTKIVRGQFQNWPFILKLVDNRVNRWTMSMIDGQLRNCVDNFFNFFNLLLTHGQS